MLTVNAVRPCPRPCDCPSVRASVAPFCRLSVWFPLAARCHYQSQWQFQQQVQFPPPPTYCCSPHIPPARLRFQLPSTGSSSVATLKRTA